MELKDSIFAKGNEDFKKVWDNKDWFPYLNENLEKINKELKEFNIERVISFDEIGSDWKDWYAKEELTLAILPISNAIDQNGENTKQQLNIYSMQLKERYMPVDLVTEEICNRNGCVAYLPTRNMIIALINPFYDQRGYTHVINMIEELDPKFMTEEDIWIERMEAQFLQRFNQIRASAEHELQREDNNISSYMTRIQQCVRMKEDIQRRLSHIGNDEEEASKKIKDQLARLKEIPIIKELEIKDRIYFSFGDVKLTGKVKTGTEIKEGVEVPIMEIREVLIGDLRFVINGERITVQNDKKVSGYEHPHASNGGICFGEISGEVSKALAEMDFVQVVKLCYSWAFSYNEKDTYTKLQTFYDARRRDDGNGQTSD